MTKLPTNAERLVEIARERETARARLDEIAAVIEAHEAERAKLMDGVVELQKQELAILRLMLPADA